LISSVRIHKCGRSWSKIGNGSGIVLAGGGKLLATNAITNYICAWTSGRSWRAIGGCTLMCNLFGGYQSNLVWGKDRDEKLPDMAVCGWFCPKPRVDAMGDEDIEAMERPKYVA